jgi:hypothetical protein
LSAICGWANGKTDEAGCADGIGPHAVSGANFNNAFSIYAPDPDYVIAPIWEIRDTGGDCISQATFMEAAMKLLGTSGGTVGFIFAQHDDWGGLWLTSYGPEYAYGNPLMYQYNSGPNYYEGCWKGHGKYWMGGFGTYEEKAVDVLHRVIDPNTSSAGNHQYYENYQATVVPTPPPPEPTY